MDKVANKDKIPCAIYVRKSNEEGLDQEYTSLDAQYESCKAYITSQAYEGWYFVEKYEDAAFSGGTLERPSLQRMLDDIKLGKIKCVVVYKIDRLSRSLLDFAKLNETFEEYKVSFVSITQNFDTSNAMGKLTLNILLSFAQFEREIASERIRDKFKASKRKGLWLRNLAPIGYITEDKRLIVDEESAKTVKYIFNKYLEYKSLTLLIKHLKEVGIKCRSWVSNRSGKTLGGNDFSHASLKTFLSDVIYIGKVRHNKDVYDGVHKGIINKAMFEKVQTILKENAHIRVKKITKSASLLSKKLTDIQGNVFTNDHTQKTVGNAKKIYRYYLGHNVRLASSEIDNIALNMIKNFFNRLDELSDSKLAFSLKKIKDPLKYASSLIEQAIFENYQFTLKLRYNNLEKANDCYLNEYKELELNGMKITIDDDHIYLIQPLKLEPKYGSVSILTLRPKHPHLDRLIKGYGYRKQLESGMSIKEIAEANNIDESYTRKLIKLAYSNLDVIEEILSL